VAEAVAGVSVGEGGLGGETLSVGDALARASVVLERAGCDTPRLDAELLLASVLGVTRTSLYLTPSASVESAGAERFESLLARRADREPVAYILGYKWFRGIRLTVDRRVLIPRPETELLVEAGLSLPEGARVADVGTGSGAVALALKDERPDLSVCGTDVSPDVLAVARENASRLGLEVAFLQADLLAGRPYDAVLANLPYVGLGAELEPEIAVYEPALALFGGADGLDLVRRLVPMLADVAFVALEIGAGQAPAVADLLAGVAAFSRVECRRDLAGHERVVVGRR
jgi:release factor glutamine methyltransferase